MKLEEAIQKDEIMRAVVDPAKITRILEHFNDQLKEHSRRIQLLENHQIT
jgi:hypothetical protein